MLCYYLGVARSTNQEMTDLKQMVWYSLTSREGDMPYHRGHPGEHEGWEVEGDATVTGVFLVVSARKEWVRHGKHV
jgi:hypothetical protein